MPFENVNKMQKFRHLLEYEKVIIFYEIRESTGTYNLLGRN